MTAPSVKLHHWSSSDFCILERSNTTEQKAHVGGPETHEKLLERQNKYLTQATSGKFQMYVVHRSDEPVGYIGYWEKTWQNQQIYETGWGIFPEYQGQGLALAATLELISILRKVAAHRFLHAFPSVENSGSNSLCKKAGFSLLGECDFEYPPGKFMRSNDWAIDLKNED